MFPPSTTSLKLRADDSCEQHYLTLSVDTTHLRCQVEEPPAADSPLWELENVVLTPVRHLVSCSRSVWGRNDVKS